MAKIPGVGYPFPPDSKAVWVAATSEGLGGKPRVMEFPIDFSAHPFGPSGGPQGGSTVEYSPELFNQRWCGGRSDIHGHGYYPQGPIGEGEPANYVALEMWFREQPAEHKDRYTGVATREQAYDLALTHSKTDPFYKQYASPEAWAAHGPVDVVKTPPPPPAPGTKVEVLVGDRWEPDTVRAATFQAIEFMAHKRQYTAAEGKTWRRSGAPATPAPEPTPTAPEPKPVPPIPPTADPLAPFFALVREWPRGLGQRAAVRQFLDWALPNVSGDPKAVLEQLERLAWPDNRREVARAFLLFARERLTGSVTPTPAPTPTPVPTPPPVGEGLTLYRKDGEVYNAASNPRGVIQVPIPRTLRLKKLQVEMDFTRGPHNPKKPTGAIGLLWIHSKGTLRPNNWIANLNVLPRNLKLQTKVDIAKGSGMEMQLLPAILEEGAHHLSFVYDAGDSAKATIGPHVLSVKSTARNGILEIPKGNLTMEFGHDVAKDSEEGTPESSSPPGWSVSNLVVTGS